jgi:hypothetical protein
LERKRQIPAQQRMNIILDENVLSKQQEWGSLLQIDDLTITELPPCPLSLSERLFLATLWLHDGTKGGHIDFPQTSYQLFCYEITRSHNSLIIFSIIFFIHLSFPFFEQPYCAWSSNSGGNGFTEGDNDSKEGSEKNNDHYDYNQAKSNKYLSQQVGLFLELFCLLFYYLEIYLRLAINPKERDKRSLDFYTKLRLVIVMLLTWDCLTSMIEKTPERMVRALLPIVYITRRKSLRQMSWGLMVVAYKCIPVFLLLLTIVLAWSYLGRMIFGNLELDGSDQFGSLVAAFLTTLESYSCRGYVVFALDPLFHINASSSLFFVSLTIFADIFCQALIVATGTRQYQLYSVTVFRKELLNRKRAMLAVFGILQQYSQQLANDAATAAQQETIESPPDPPTSRPNSTKMNIDFGSLPRTPKPFWDERSSDSSNDTRTTHTNATVGTNRESLYDPRIDYSDLRISKKAWLDFCSHLTGKKKISLPLAELLFDKEIESEEFGLNRNSWNRDSIPRKEKRRSNAMANEGLSVVGFFRVAALLDGELNIEGDIDSDDDDDEFEEINEPIHNPTVTLKRPTTKRSSSESFRMPTNQSLDPSLALLFGTGTKSTPQQDDDDDTNGNRSRSLPPKKSAENIFFRPFRWIYKKSRILARYIAETEIILDLRIPFLQNTRSVTRHGIFDTIVSCTRILLAVQLLYLTIPSSPIYWYDIGWALHGFFWFEMYIRIASLYSKRRRRNIRLFLLNLITTALYSTIDRTQSHGDEISGRMLVYICFQWFRLVQVILPFRISDVIRGLLSLVIRVVFLVFTVIYFFSTIGYYRFCNAFDSTEAEEVDDFAVKWAPYEQQLNFNTMLQTMYTLFEVAVLGSWSYVMRAAMLSGFLSALLYFYAYRLLMTLVVMPILTSFIIQAYNARSIKLTNAERKLLEKHYQEKKQEMTTTAAVTKERVAEEALKNMNVILEVDETIEETCEPPLLAPADAGAKGEGEKELKEEKERMTDCSRGSRLTGSTSVSQKSDRKIIVTRGESPLALWSESLISPSMSLSS